MIKNVLFGGVFGLGCFRGNAHGGSSIIGHNVGRISEHLLVCSGKGSPTTAHHAAQQKANQIAWQGET